MSNEAVQKLIEAVSGQMMACRGEKIEQDPIVEMTGAMIEEAEDVEARMPIYFAAYQRRE